MSKRDLSGLHLIEKRAEKKIEFCSSTGMQVVSPKYDSSGEIVTKQKSIKTYGYKNPAECDDYDFGLVGIPTDTSQFATEHILEFQLLKIFFEAKSDNDGFIYKNAAGTEVDLCAYMKEYWSVKAENEEGSPIQLLPKVFPGKDNAYVDEFVLLDKYVNGMKERVSSPPVPDLLDMARLLDLCRCGAASNSPTRIK